MRMTLLAALATSTVSIGLLTSGPAHAAETWSYQAALGPVAANLVSGNGASWISVTGNTAQVQIQVNGLLPGAPHAQSIRINGQGSCPAQSSAPVGATDGQARYGAGSRPDHRRRQLPGRSVDTRPFPVRGVIHLLANDRPESRGRRRVAERHRCSAGAGRRSERHRRL